MWAYRLDPTDPFGLLLTVENVRAKLPAHHSEIDRDIDTTKLMARALGWDDTMVDPIRCFIMPGPTNFMVGYLLTQATSNQRYVISPMPLAYLIDQIDWDAHTSIEEVQKMRAALTGQAAIERPPIRAGDWSVSRKGNMFTQINGANVTIFPLKGGTGYKGIISTPNTDRKIFTQVFQTEHEAAQHIIKNFYEIVKTWGAPTDEYDNPFTGINFEDDDIPF